MTIVVSQPSDSAPISSYALLKASIANFLHRSDLTALIPEFIADGENRIYNDLRIRQMEVAYTGTTASTALPTGFLEWIFLIIDDDHEQKLSRRDAEWIYTRYPSSSGKPVYFAREGDALLFAPTPDATYTLSGRYYKKLDALSDSNTTNWLITDAPELLRFAALAEAAPYIMDDARVGLWEGKYQAMKQRIQSTERRESRSGSLLSTIPG